MPSASASSAHRSELHQLFVGHAGDSWQSSLSRYERFLRSEVDEYVDEDSGDREVLVLAARHEPEVLMRRRPPMTPAEMGVMRQALPLAVPAALDRLLGEHGAFDLYDDQRSGHVLTFVRGRPGAPWPLRPLLDEMREVGAGHFVEFELGPAQCERLAQELLCFARVRLSDSDHVFLVFDRTEGFGLLEFVSEDYDGTLARVGQLLQGPLHLSLDEVLRRAINWTVYEALRDNEVPLDEDPAWIALWSDHMPCRYQSY